MLVEAGAGIQFSAVLFL